MSGGPTKVEFLCHRDTTPVAAALRPQLLAKQPLRRRCASRSREGEPWTKVIGPFFLYVNSGDDPQEIWHDASRQCSTDGQLALRLGQRESITRIFASGVRSRAVPARMTSQRPMQQRQPPGRPDARAYTPPVARPGGFGRPRQVDWQTDAKHYQFSARGNDDMGNFAIPDVRAGKYVLRTITDGVLASFPKATSRY